MNGTDRSLVRSIRGPVTLITVGVLFALNNFTPYRFDQTWPVILIVFGLLSLLRRGTEPARPQAPVGTPQWIYPQPGSAAGYRGSSYGGYTPPPPPMPPASATRPEDSGKPPSTGEAQ